MDDDKFISELDALETLEGDDLLVAEEEDDETHFPKKISVGQLQNFVLGNVPDLDTDVPLMQDITFTYNEEDNIEWTSETQAKILYAGIYYNISPGSTDKIYVYWDQGDPNQFYCSDAQLVTKWLMCYKDTTDEAVYPAFQQKIIHGGYIKAKTVVADTINIPGVDDDGNLDLKNVGDGDVYDIDGEYKIYVNDNAPGSEIEGLVGRWSLAETNYTLDT